MAKFLWSGKQKKNLSLDNLEAPCTNADIQLQCLPCSVLVAREGPCAVSYPVAGGVSKSMADCSWMELNAAPSGTSI